MLIPSGLKAPVVVFALVAAFFMWRHWQDRMHRQELYDCKLVAAIAGNLSDCLTERYGWDDRDATDAFLDDLKKRYPGNK